MLSRVDLLNKSVECSVVLSDRCISSRCQQAHYTVISHYTPGFFLFFFFLFLCSLSPLLNFKTNNHLVCLFISLTLHAVINVFSCVKVSILCDASVSSSHLISPRLPYRTTRLVSIDIHIQWTNGVGSAAGKRSLLCWSTVPFVVLILFFKHLVCQIVEKNKLKPYNIRCFCVMEFSTPVLILAMTELCMLVKYCYFIIQNLYCLYILEINVEYLIIFSWLISLPLHNQLIVI